MTNVTSPAQSLQLTQGKALLAKQPMIAPGAEQVAEAQETKEHFTEFFGKTFYGQMLKSMRSAVGKPAYFHGGRAEEVFRGQLDQEIADQMSDSSAGGISEGAFQQQFPRRADILRRHEATQDAGPSGLDQLAMLRKR